MIEDLWMLASFGPVLCLGTAIAFAHRRRRVWRTDAGDVIDPVANERIGFGHRASTIEAAERELGILLRRMRAYARAPYDFAASRIVGADEFERCLDLATELSLHLEELSGAVAATSLERERARDQILSGLSTHPPIRPPHSAQSRP